MCIYPKLSSYLKIDVHISVDSNRTLGGLLHLLHRFATTSLPSLPCRSRTTERTSTSVSSATRCSAPGTTTVTQRKGSTSTGQNQRQFHYQIWAMVESAKAVILTASLICKKGHLFPIGLRSTQVYLQNPQAQNPPSHQPHHHLTSDLTSQDTTSKSLPILIPPSVRTSLTHNLVSL